MKKETIDEVIACLPQERTLFHYFKGQYAFTLLSYATQHQQSVSALKKSNYQRLLNQPAIKTLLAQQGNGQLCPELFQWPWNESSETFVLTVDQWGNDNWGMQTTRSGGNLVLQLNFSGKHNHYYEKLVKPKCDAVFNGYGHPVMTRDKREFFRETLAWSRIDLNFSTSEALIEEIQNDWLRRILASLERIKANKPSYLLSYCGCEPKQFISYVDNVLKPFFTIWSEAMLMASIRFIYEELGINRIYYHSYESGNKLKYAEAPRSLYSDLPRKFCFELTEEDPAFLMESRSYRRKRRKIKDVQWYKLEL